MSGGKGRNGASARPARHTVRYGNHTLGYVPALSCGTRRNLAARHAEDPVITRPDNRTAMCYASGNHADRPAIKHLTRDLRKLAMESRYPARLGV